MLHAEYRLQTLSLVMVYSAGNCADDVCMQIAPKEDELRAFQAYQGTYEELTPPEQFLYTMATVPRLNDKINVLILMHQFEVSSNQLWMHPPQPKQLLPFC